MTAYNANTTVTINGTDYSGSCLRQITVSMGRPDLQQQPQAGYCRVQLITDWDTPIPVEANQPLVIAIYNPVTDAQQAIFTGRVSDYSVSVEAAGVVSGVARYDVTAVGPLADLARQTCGEFTSYTETSPAVIIEEWLGEAFGITWDEIGEQYTWDTIGLLGTTWDDLSGVDQIGFIDPSNWRLDWTAAETNALEAIHLATNSVMGVFYETGDGKLNFYDNEFRFTQSITEIPKEIIGTNFTSTMRTGEVVNRCGTDDFSGANVQTWTNAESVLTYDLLATTRETLLTPGYTLPYHLYEQNLQQSIMITNSRGTAYLYPETFTVYLSNPAVTDTMRDFFLNVFCGSRIKINNLPTALFSDAPTFFGYIEGYTWNLTDIMADITFSISDQRNDLS